MVTEQVANQIGSLFIFGCLLFCGLGILLGIIIKHWIDLPYILACRYSKGAKDE